MRLPLLRVAALCAAPLAAACDLKTTPITPPLQVDVSGFAGKGVFSDSVPTGAPFQLVAPDSSGQGTGQLMMVGDVVPPAGTYDVDHNQFPQNLSQLAVVFLRPPAGGSAELYDPLGGNMVLTSVAGDSIAGTLAFTMFLAAICTGPHVPADCQQVMGNSKQLTLSGSFVAQRTAAATYPGS